MNLQDRRQVSARLDHAAVYLDAGMLQRAADEVAAALRLDPGSARGRLLDARIAVQMNRPKQALQSLDAHDLYEPDNRDTPAPAMLRAQALIMAEQFDLARQVVAPLCERFPDDQAVHQLMAGIALAAGRNDDAVTHLTVLSKLRPHDRAIRSALARALAASAPQDAVDLLSRDARDHRDTEALLATIGLLVAAGRLAEADDAATRLLETHDDDPAVRREAGAVADMLGDTGRAIAHLEASRRLRDSHSTRRLLALALMHAGRFGEAGRVWRQCTRALTRSDEAWAGLLVCAVAARRWSLARRVRRRIKRRIGKTAVRRKAARLWFDAESALLANPAADHTHTQDKPLQQLLRRAADLLEAQADKHPMRADIHYHLGQCRALLGETDAATNAVDQALAVNDKYDDAQRLAVRLGA